MGVIHEPFNDDSIYYSDKEYVSNSMLGKLRENVHKFAMWKRGFYTYPPMVAYVVGRYFHTMVLEPEKLSDFVVSKYQTRNGAGFKSQQEEVGFDWLVTQREHDMCENMAKKLWLRPKLKEIVEASEKEVPFIGEYMGVPVKSKLDLVLDVDRDIERLLMDENGMPLFTDGQRIVGDLKSTSKSVSAFAKSANMYDYDRQAAMYSDIADADGFLFIPVEKDFPWTPAIAWTSGAFIKNGYGKLDRDMRFYKELFMEGQYKPDYLYELTL